MPAFKARQVFVDAAGAVLLAASDMPPQDGLRVVRLGAILPAQQPVTAPRLVFLEHPTQLRRQRPGAQRIAPVQVSLQPGHRRTTHQLRIGQCRVQTPVQPDGTQIIPLATDVGLERPRHELTGGEELQIGGNAVLGRQRGLQPTPHRHLRDQHRIGRQQRLPRRRLAQCMGQQRSQHIE
ncbi:hypothetical protein D3C81_1396230 [compost metagenome]